MEEKEKNNLQNTVNSQYNVSSFPKGNEALEVSNRINNTKKKNTINNMDNSNNLENKRETLDKKSGLSKKDIGKNVLKTSGNTLLNKASESDTIVGDTARGINKVRSSIRGIKTTSRVLKSIFKFFSTPIGWGCLLFVGILLLMILIVVVFHTIISSLSMKYNLTSKDSYEMFSQKYSESMSRSEIDSIYGSDDACGPVGLFTSIKNFFDIYNVENPQELCLYVKHKLEEKEQLNGISTLSPGYFLSTLYYAFDTQNNDVDGKSFIRFDETSEEIYTDIDAVSLLFASKIFTKSDLDKLIDEFIIKYDLENNGLSSYSLYIEYDSDGNEISSSCKVNDNYVSYQTSETKFNLNLRYGENISANYQKDMNIIKAYELSDSDCYDMIGVNKPDLSKYDTKYDLTTSSTDIPSIDGYTYKDGFIYNRYPRYMAIYNLGQVKPTFDYRVVRDIENIIVNSISSRQDYINYLLGYPNTVKTNVLSLSGNCSYRIKGENVSNLYVRLLHGANDVIPNIESNSVIEGQELIEFEKYILGVVYAESGSNSDEALKAQAIAARTYTFNRGKLVEEDGKYLLEISNSTNDQTYCDPDLGCYRYYVPKHSSTVNVYTKGTEPSKDELSSDAVESYTAPLENDSHIRKAVKAVAGIYLTDSSGNAYSVGYNSKTQNTWNTLAKQGYDYVELLRNTYGGDYILSSPSCNFATGDWDSWRQYSSEWGNMILSTKTVAKVGCFITSHAKAIAKSGAQVNISNFNPGTFVTSIKEHGCLSGNSLDRICALDGVLVNKYISKSESLSGSIFDKVSVISKYLNEGYEVILRVKWPGPDREHWVLVTGVSGGTIYMSDPASDYNEVLSIYNASEVKVLLAYKFDQ